jgi:hypothetical protein
LLFGFIASVSLCGLVGVYCLLLGSWGQLQARVLGTTATIAAASILGLISAIPWERRIWPPVGLLGCSAVSVALVQGLIAIWLPNLPNDEFMKSLGVACVVAVALPLVGLLALVRLRPEYLWVRLVTVAAIAVHAGQWTLTIVGELEGEFWFRTMGVTAIAGVCGTIAVAVLHRVSAIPATGTGLSDTLSARCPRCGHGQQLPVGRSTCCKCGLGFRIEIDPVDDPVSRQT